MNAVETVQDVVYSLHCPGGHGQTLKVLKKGSEDVIKLGLSKTIIRT